MAKKLNAVNQAVVVRVGHSDDAHDGGLVLDTADGDVAGWGGRHISLSLRACCVSARARESESARLRKGWVSIVPQTRFCMAAW